MADATHPQPPSEKPVEIAEAVTADDLAEIAAMFTSYADSVLNTGPVDEVRSEALRLPGIYAPPRGALLLARQPESGEVLGCVALKPLPGPGDAECRRLFVRSAARGRSVGMRLGRAVIERARALGYNRILIEAHQSLLAHSVYHEAGFRPIPSYYANPDPGTVYLALDLTDSQGEDPPVEPVG